MCFPLLPRDVAFILQNIGIWKFEWIKVECEKFEFKKVESIKVI